MDLIEIQYVSDSDSDLDLGDSECDSIDDDDSDNTTDTEDIDNKDDDINNDDDDLRETKLGDLFPLYTIAELSDDSLDENDEEFDPEKYSKMNYKSRSVLEKYYFLLSRNENWF